MMRSSSAMPRCWIRATVGVLVDAGLVAAQVNRHAVRDFVVQGLVDPLARGHGFSCISWQQVVQGLSRGGYDVGRPIGWQKQNPGEQCAGFIWAPRS